MTENSSHSEQQQSAQPTPGNSNDTTVPHFKSDDLLKAKEKIDQKLETEGKCPQPFIVKMDKSRGWSKQEIFSFVGLCFSFLAFITALYSISQTVRSVNISEATFKNNRMKDIQAATQQRKRDSLDSIQRDKNNLKDSTTLALAQNSLKAQLESVGESQKQFKVLNRPILQIGDIALVNFAVGKRPTIVCKIENAGSFAAKAITRKIRLGYVHSIAERPKGKWMELSIPTYVTKESPIIENFFTNDPVDSQYYNAIVNGTMKILVTGEVDYINEVTKERWIFEFAIEIKPPPSTDFTIRVANNRLKSM